MNTLLRPGLPKFDVNVAAPVVRRFFWRTSLQQLAKLQRHYEHSTQFKPWDNGHNFLIMLLPNNDENSVIICIKLVYNVDSYLIFKSKELLFSNDCSQILTSFDK